MAELGFLKPAPEAVQQNVSEYWSEDWAEYGTYDGTLYGAPLMASVKGWIWYSPSQFAENGWEVPTDWQGLLALTAQVQSATGAPPWCIRFGPDAATCCTGPHSIEHIVLRPSGTPPYAPCAPPHLPSPHPP